MHSALQLYQRKRFTSTTATTVLYYWRLLIKSFSVGSEAMKPHLEEQLPQLWKPKKRDVLKLINISC